MRHISHLDSQNINRRLKVHAVGLPAVLHMAFCLTIFETNVGYTCNTGWDFIVWNNQAKLPKTVVFKAIHSSK